MANPEHSGGSGRSKQRFNTTPQGIKRDDTEAEIDSNLDQISSGLGRIKMMGRAMNQEMVAQDDQIRRIQDKTSKTDERVQRSTGRLNAMLKKK